MSEKKSGRYFMKQIFNTRFITRLTFPPMLILLATLLLAFKGIFAKFAYADGMSVSQLVFLRFIIAVPLFWLALIVPPRRHLVPVSLKTATLIIITALCFAIATFSDFSALFYISTGLSRLILFTYPSLVILFLAFTAKRLPSQQHVLAFTITYFALCLILYPSLTETHIEQATWYGIGFSSLCAVSYGLFWIFSKPLIAEIGSRVFTAYVNTAILILLLPWLLSDMTSAQQHVLSIQDLVWGGVIAVVCTFLPFLLLYEGIRRWTSEQAAILTLTSPVITLAAAWLLLDETLDIMTVIAVPFLLFGVWMAQHKNK